MGTASAQDATRKKPSSTRLLAIGAVCAIAVLAAVVVGIGRSSAATPVVSTVSPAFGRASGGNTVTITGTGLQGTTAVDFGARPARFSVVSDTKVTAVAPPGSGVVVVRVTGASSARDAARVDLYTYVPVPTVHSISPVVGPSRGGTTVLVRGTGFVPGATVLIGGHPARSVHLVNRDALTAVVPAGFGTLAVRVVTPGGTSHASSAVVFGYSSKVLVVGDSLGIDLGWGFGPQLAGGRLLDVTDDSVGSTGIVRWDAYNWATHLRTDLDQVHPDVVVVLFGANDQQPIQTAHGLAPVGSKAWDAAYAARVRELTSLATARGATVAWVGVPRMGPTSGVSASFVAEVLRVDQGAVKDLPHAVFVSTASLFTTPAGRYTPYVTLGPHDVVIGRQPDEVHLTPAGALAIDLLAVRSLTQLASSAAS